MRKHQKRVTRRQVLRSATILPVTARMQDATPPATPVPVIRGTRLRVLMPAHPVQGFNDAVRSLATDWAAIQGLTVQIDIIPPADIPAATEIQLDAGEGHDLIGSDWPMLHHADSLRDLSDLFARAREQFGPPADVCATATSLPDGTRPAFSIGYAPAPLIYRRSIWEAYGLPAGPATWDQLRDTGALIWREEGLNVGLGLSPEPGSERVAEMLMTAFGATMVGDEDEVTLESDEAVAAVRFMVELYREAMSPESLDWEANRPATLLADGIASIISDDISALRLAQGRSGDVANDLFLAPPPAGPSGTTPQSLPASFRAFHIPRHAANLAAAEAFLLMLVASSEALAGSGQLTDRPAYGSLVPGLVQAGGWLDADPYGSTPREKLAMLKGSAAWTVAPSGALATQAHAEFVLARMMANAAQGDLSPEDAVTQAAQRLRALR